MPNGPRSTRALPCAAPAPFAAPAPAAGPAWASSCCFPSIAAASTAAFWRLRAATCWCSTGFGPFGFAAAGLGRVAASWRRSASLGCKAKQQSFLSCSSIDIDAPAYWSCLLQLRLAAPAPSCSAKQLRLLQLLLQLLQLWSGRSLPRWNCWFEISRHDLQMKSVNASTMADLPPIFKLDEGGRFAGERSPPQGIPKR